MIVANAVSRAIILGAFTVTLPIAFPDKDSSAKFQCTPPLATMSLSPRPLAVCSRRAVGSGSTDQEHPGPLDRGGIHHPPGSPSQRDIALCGELEEGHKVGTAQSPEESREVASSPTNPTSNLSSGYLYLLA